MSGEAWNELVAVGLLGTERRPLPTTVTDAVTEILGPGSAPEALSGEVGVLTAAGVLSAYRRTGTSAVSAVASVPSTTDADPRPVAPEPALRLLDLLLAGHVSVFGPSQALVGLWLKRCAEGGYRLPPGHLVSVIGSATNRAELREPAAAAVGALGQWLATRNPAWSWITGAGPVVHAGSEDDVDRRRLWETGTRDERMGLLREVRRHDPASGLDLVESTWSSEKAADRAAIIEAMAPTVSMIDEPFLEAALDDRAKSVRERAAAVLQTFPESRLAERASALLAPLIAQPKGLMRKKVEVSAPTQADRDALIRDGFNDLGRPGTVGPLAWALTYLAATAPLRTWTDLLSMSPADVVAATSHNANFNDLVQGWARAVQAQHEAHDRGAWALALLDLPSADPQLLRWLTPDIAHREATKRLKSWPEARLGGVISALPGPWPVELTQRIIERLSTLKNVGQMPLQSIATNAPPESIPDLQAWAARLDGDEHAYLLRSVNQVVSTISFRQSIIQELP